MTRDITTELNDLTDRVIAVRVLTQRGATMPLEIKGLKGSMMKVAQRIERINEKAVVFDQVGAELEQGLDDITAQVKGHGADLEFAATVLGNSTSGGDSK